MKIPIFAEAIKKCDVVLRPRGYDIVHIICDKNPTIYVNIINCFLGIAAIQIGLVDTLYTVGVKPNYMIGHSVVESDLIHGTMAAVGLGYKQLRHFCSEDIDVTCHNGPDSSTISGPTESIKAFVKELQESFIILDFQLRQESSIREFLILFLERPHLFLLLFDGNTVLIGTWKVVNCGRLNKLKNW
ncbi:fatty acid synthase-like isoform X2 [Polistes fuscatus]|uniref:fatty acid synthase-like isoform X2 n=1 Tax=Polistes fuscatus TaxID=30207 RepID=UPI001CA86387|nr:fatty acid synthase-like isoform X2 [Polistes fuscatus]XP_043503326.1 fatty acid synthase-like isoform X2 [Polistes fuscatus]